MISVVCYESIGQYTDISEEWHHSLGLLQSSMILHPHRLIHVRCYWRRLWCDSIAVRGRAPTPTFCWYATTFTLHPMAATAGLLRVITMHNGFE
jgi:hypothetical protein